MIEDINLFNNIDTDANNNSDENNNHLNANSNNTIINNASTKISIKNNNDINFNSNVKNDTNTKFQHNFISKKDENFLQNTYLGKATLQSNEYNPKILQKIVRNKNANYFGWDIWNLYELFWIDKYSNQPTVAIGVLYIDANSNFIVESKSLKLYLNSLHNLNATIDELKNLIEKDISNLLETKVILKINKIEAIRRFIEVPGFCLNSILEKNTNHNLIEKTINNNQSIDTNIESYTIKKSQNKNKEILFKVFQDENIANFNYIFHLNNIISYCPVTSQPDFATFVICIEFILQEKLAIILDQIYKYILSKNGNSDFHESHVQRIYDYIVQLFNFYKIESKIIVYAHYTRRGGIDICPYRANFNFITYPEMFYFNRQ